MNTKYKKIFTVVAAVLVIALAGALYANIFRNKTQDEQTIVQQHTSTDSPTDIALDFYDAWLKAKQSTSTDPYQSGLATQTILSETLRAKLESSTNQTDGAPDPVLCQTVTPERFVARTVFATENETQILITAKDGTLPGQTVVALSKNNDGWYIKDIICSSGESAPEQAFSFDKSGNLLKSVPPPLDPQYWYIVFEENGVPGHFAPLFMNDESICQSIDGTETVCSADTFSDAAKVHVRGDMTERGVEVKQIDFIE